MARRALVTGSAGFIGYHLCRRLLADGWEVTGLDALTDYYDVTLKQRRHAMLAQSPAFHTVEGRLESPGLVRDLADGAEVIVHLAAQAGVRQSIDAPRSYVDANLIGTYEVLEAARATAPAHLLIASTSSVYGANAAMPYAEVDKADTPMSFYAATKKAGEVMAHSYAHLYAIPTTMFRFFTVYGPWGRPDMALFKFTRAILAGEPVDIYNHGDMRRDFTYVDDIVEGVVRVLDKPAAPQEGSHVPYRIFNIGNSQPEKLMDFIGIMEHAFGKVAEKEFLPMQAGDVKATYADTSALEGWVGFKPSTPLVDGIRKFAAWYQAYYKKP